MRRRIVLSIACGLLLVATIAELALRVLPGDGGSAAGSVRVRVKAQAEIRHAPYHPDPELGAVLQPARELRVETPDYSYTLRTDHAGFPNRDPWPQRIDVAVLGNSLITGAGVGLDGQFTTLLQPLLGGRSVLNLGVHGGGTEHELRAYQAYAAPLHPRLVIATLWLTWEIDNTMQFASWLQLEPRPDFRSYLGSYKEIHRSPLQRSRLVRRLSDLTERWLRGWTPVEQVQLASGETLWLAAVDELRLAQGWSRPGHPDLRPLFFEPLEQLRAAVEADGGRLLVVLFPSKEELYAADAIPQLLEPVRVARAELARRRFEVLDLYPVMQPAAEPRALFFPTDRHMNALGHQIAAEAIAAHLRLRESLVTPAG